jgi:hypothetical protein
MTCLCCLPAHRVDSTCFTKRGIGGWKMKYHSAAYRAPLLHTQKQLEIFFPQFDFRPAERAPSWEWLIPEPPSPDREGTRNRAGVDSHDVPLAGLRDLESALPTGNNRAAEEPKSGLFGSQNRLSGQLHRKYTRNIPPYLPVSHSRFRKRMEGWRFSLKSKSKPSGRTIAEQYAEMERSQGNLY